MQVLAHKSQLAATNKVQPDTAFTGHWNQDQQYRVPLDHRCINDIASFLMNFPSMIP
jgi:hypothetical protein